MPKMLHHIQTKRQDKTQLPKLSERLLQNKEVLQVLRLSVGKDEYLMVGKEVRITFLGVNERSIELMIDAPREVNVARGKAIRKRAAEKESASNKSAGRDDGLNQS